MLCARVWNRWVNFSCIHFFLVKGGAFIVEWNPRIVKDHTASRRGGGSALSKMANDSHTAHLCRGSAVWRKPRGLRRNLSVWKPNKAARKCTDKWGARKGRQTGKGGKNIKRCKQYRLMGREQEKACTSWEQECYVCVTGDMEFQRPRSMSAKRSPDFISEAHTRSGSLPCITITLFNQLSWAKTRAVLTI